MRASLRTSWYGYNRIMKSFDHYFQSNEEYWYATFFIKNNYPARVVIDEGYLIWKDRVI